MRILIAEDEAVVARDLEETLHEFGHSVVGIVDTAEDVLLATTTTEPDLVLMDIRLRGEFDGITAGQQVRDHHQVPVIYLTAHTDAETRRRAALTEPFGYLIKPFNEHMLQSALEIAYYKHQTEQRLRASEQQLAASVRALEQRTHELTVFGELSGAFLRCGSVEEGYAVIARAAHRLFADADGVLSIARGHPPQFKPVIVWGKNAASFPSEHPQTCWALRNERIFIGVCATCANPQIAPDPIGCSICVPLVASGETIGLLHLRFPSDMLEVEASYGQLALALAEQAALGLANVQMRTMLREEAIRDALTGLFNRRYLEEMLTREQHRAVRNQYPISVMILDIDHFKQINDTFGHAAGDALLRAVGRLLLSRVRAEDIVCRYGGEEFVLVLPSATSEVSYARAEAIRQDVSALRVLHANQHLPPITISIGIACIISEQINAAAALQQADEALYQAKASGRNQTIMAPSAPPRQRASEQG